MQRLDDCVINANFTDTVFYSFDKSNFDIKLIQNLFDKNVLIDSAFDNRGNGLISLHYTFKDKNSKVVFSLYDVSKGKRNFDIAYLDLKTDIFKFRNGIKVNMTRSDFFKAMKLKETDCDTILIDPKTRRNWYDYRFEFKNDTLRLIKTEYIKM